LALILQSNSSKIERSRTMENKEKECKKKETYIEPKIVATYTKEELEKTIKPHGNAGYNGKFPP